jgi:hypothetical protein
MNVHSWRFRVAAVATSAALLSGGALAANASTPTTAKTHAGGACTFRAKAVAAYATLPSTLTSDLATLKKDTGAARRTEAKLIRSRALAGYYGDTIEARAKALKGKAVVRLAKIPVTLKAEFKDIRAANTRTEKKALVAKTVKAAEAGTYGAEIETVAKKLAASSAYASCVAS